MGIMALGQKGRRRSSPQKFKGGERPALQGQKDCFPEKECTCVTSQIASPHLRTQKQRNPKTPKYHFPDRD